MKCFFKEHLDNIQPEHTDNETMQSRSATTATADNTFTTTAVIKIKGAKDLKKYNTAAAEALENITETFQADLRASGAVVDVSDIRDKNLRFKAEMCAVEQRTFVHNISHCYPSPVVGAKEAAHKCLENLDEIRKMLVNNKQKRNTTIKRIWKIIQKTSSANAATIALLQVVPDAEEHPVAVDLKGLIEETKQNHKTVAKNLRTQAIFNMRQMRKCLLAYQEATESVVQQIINHGEKNRAMVRKYQDIELIEYCARAWWSETQKDPMDRGKYTVSALEAPPHDGCPEISTAFRPSLHRHYYNKSRGPHSPFQHVNISSVVITVRDDNRSCYNPNGCVVDTFYLAESKLAKEILNESVIRSFEETERNGGNAKAEAEAEAEEESLSSSWLQQLYAAGVHLEDMGEEQEEE